MRKTSLIVAAVLAFAGLAAAAENQAAAPTTPEAPSRYAFNRVNDGFLRLDNVSGQIAFCSPTSAGWACQAVPEDRAALEKEIARLQDEVTDLKQQVASLREPPPPRPPADLSKPDSASPSAQSERAAELRADLSRAKAAVQSAWQKLVDMISGFQKDMMRKS
jgi:cell division protein FtsB